MRCFLSSTVLGTLCACLCVAVPSPAQNPPAPEARSPSVSTPHTRLPASISNGATFINPKEGQIVRPGETFNIDLNVDSGVTPVKGVGIVSPMGISNEAREGPPYSFTFTVPDTNLTGATHRLIGFQQLTLFGTVVGRKDYDLATTTIDVEESDLPLSFFAAGGTISQWDRVPNHLSFFGSGVDQQIDIYARFANGHELDVTESTYLSLSSENSAVAIVADDGTIASVGPGETRIIVTYSLKTQRKLFYIPVTVHRAVNGLDVSPATFDFGDVPSNTASAPIQITITNHTRSDVRMFKLEPRGGFLVTLENCSDTILAPGGSCAMTVKFSPISPGQEHSNIFLPNSHTAITSISLFGNGI